MKFIKLFTTILILLLNIQAKAQTKVIPFKYDAYLRLTATLNDSLTGNFIFDTGAGITIIDSAWLARSVTPKSLHNINVRGLGENSLKAKYTTDSLKFTCGGHTSLCTAAVIANLPVMMPLECDGLLSIHHFDTIYSIDYINQHIKILKNTDSLAGYTKIPYKTSNNNGFIEFEVEAIIDSTKGKTIKEIVHLDTGNSGTVDFSPDNRKMKKLKRQLGNTIEVDLAVRGIGGGGKSHIFQLQGLRIGSYFVNAQYGTIMENTAIKKGKPNESSGLIGNAITDHFDIVIDRTNRNLYLRPNRDFQNPIPPRYLGAYISQIDFPRRLLVNGVKANYEGPLKQGDVITHIDNIDANQFSSKELDLYYNTPDRTYTLTILRDNKTLTLQVKNLNNQTLWQ